MATSVTKQVVSPQDQKTNVIPAPLNFVGLVNDNKITFSWSLVTDAVSYLLERSYTSKFDDLITVYSGAGNGYVDTEVIPGTTYFYRLSAVEENYASLYTTLELTTLYELQAPTLTISGITSTGLVVAWTSVSNATGYVLQRSTASNFETGLTTDYTGDLLSHTETGLTPSTHYYFRVCATNEGYNNKTYGICNGTTAAS